MGLQVWRGALLLADWLLHHCDTLPRGKKVLELGSGVGLTSIVASMYSPVVCTGIIFNPITLYRILTQFPDRYRQGRNSGINSGQHKKKQKICAKFCWSNWIRFHAASQRCDDARASKRCNYTSRRWWEIIVKIIHIFKWCKFCLNSYLRWRCNWSFRGYLG